MSFRIKGLPAATFVPLFNLSEADLASRAAVRVTADKNPGFPCRVSLRDAEKGENLVLVNFEHHAVATPFRSRHAILVRENASEAQLGVDEVPEVLLTRLLSLRAFDEKGMMIEADAMHGRELAVAINRMYASRQIEYLHVHYAKPGCFAARVDRA